MKNLFRFILALALLTAARAQNVSGGGTQGTTGTVKSVGLSAPAFLSVSGSPVTTTGTLALSYSGTALPVANGGTGITSFGTGVATFLGTPSSANLASAVTDETGSGLLVFGTSPTFTTSTTVTSNGLATTSADGHVIQNTTAATSGVTVQYSPRIHFVGHGWNTTSTAADNYVEMTEELRPTSAATPTGALTWSFRRSTAGSGSFVDFGSVAPDTTSGGVNIAAIGTNQNVVLTPSGTGSVVGPVGAVGTPSFTFSGDTDTGVYHPAANTMDVAVGGAINTRFVSTHVLIGGLTTDNGSDQIQLAGGSSAAIATSTGNLLLRPAGTTVITVGTTPLSTGQIDFSPAGTSTSGVVGVRIAGGTVTSSSGAHSAVLINPTYNQSGTAAATDLTINRSQTATGSGAQLLIDGQVSGPSKFSVDNAGLVKSGGFARVTGDVTNATATMSNLTNLSVAVATGVKYVGTIQIFANDSTGADGLAFDLGGGAATFTDLEFGFAAQPTGSTLGTVTSTTSTSAITLTVVSTSDAVYTVSFGFTCNAGGTFIPRFAQNSHSAGTATVRKNSGIITLASTN